MPVILIELWEFLAGGASKLFGALAKLPWYVLVIGLLVVILLLMVWHSNSQAATIAKDATAITQYKADAQTDADSIKTLQGQVSDCNARVATYAIDSAKSEAAGAAALAKDTPAIDNRTKAAATLRAAPPVPPAQDVTAPAAYQQTKGLL